MIRSLLAASALALTAPLAPMALAEEAAQIGPQIGDTHAEFTANDVTGEAMSLTDISGEAGAVLVFSRSLDWCPFCKSQAVDLIEADAPLADLGWDLNLITYDAPDFLAGYASETDVPYTLLSDEGSAMIDALNLRNHDVPAGSVYDGIPHPAIVFFTPEGEVVSVLREEGYRERPPVEMILETASELNASS